MAGPPGANPMSTANPDDDLVALGERFEKFLLEYMDAWLEWAPLMRAARAEVGDDIAVLTTAIERTGCEAAQACMSELERDMRPHPTKPPAYERQGYLEDDLIDFTPALRAEAIKIPKQYRLGPVFTPPSEVKPDGTKGTWYNPGGTGGSLWQGGAFDPETGYFYIPSKTGPGIISVAHDPKSDMRFSRSRGSVALA